MYQFAIAVGMSCAMGSPIGGVLYSIELTSDIFITKNFSRLFFASAFSAVVVYFFSFSNYISATQTENYFPGEEQMYELFLFLVMGVLIAFLITIIIQTTKRVAALYKIIDVGFPKKKKKMDSGGNEGIASFTEYRGTSGSENKQESFISYDIIPAVPPVFIGAEAGFISIFYFLYLLFMKSYTLSH
jgi:hypothetical protein